MKVSMKLLRLVNLNVTSPGKTVVGGGYALSRRPSLVYQKE